MNLLSYRAYFPGIKFTALCLIYALFLQVSYCESPNARRYIASSIVGMENLLNTERKLLDAMGNYTIFLEKKLTVIRSAIAEMRTEYNKSKDNPEEYLSIPTNSYALIRRLNQDWVRWQLYLQSSVGKDEINSIKELRADFPSSNDFNETVEALYRLQMTYDLNPIDMAAGILHGKQFDARFSAMDCYSIGRELLANDYYQVSAIWLNISLQLYQDSDINVVHHFDKTKIYEVYAKALQKQGRFADALEAIDNALQLSPHNAGFLKLKSDINFQHQTTLERETAENKNLTGKYYKLRHEGLCRNEYINGLSKQQYCVYNRTASKFLHLAPMKMELINFDPYIVLYHDVISDAGIISLKEFTSPKLTRSSVYDAYERTEFVNNVRNAKSLWVHDDTNEFTKRVSQRIADMTGFDVSESLQSQVSNYGLGGNFELHHDSPPSTADLRETRASTVLLYLSDVVHGGGTVFPKINITVYPQKGSALFWYNLKPNGDADLKAQHVACPVIVGSKWISAKFVLEDSQMFRKPCSLNDK